MPIFEASAASSGIRSVVPGLCLKLGKSLKIRGNSASELPGLIHSVFQPSVCKPLASPSGSLSLALSQECLVFFSGFESSLFGLKLFLQEILNNQHGIDPWIVCRHVLILLLVWSALLELI